MIGLNGGSLGDRHNLHNLAAEVCGLVAGHPHADGRVRWPCPARRASCFSVLPIEVV